MHKREEDLNLYEKDTFLTPNYTILNQHIPMR